MAAFHDDMTEYHTQLEKGVIQKAYKGLLEYILGLKTYFQKKYPEYSVSGSLYEGYMDMTYFALFPEPLKQRKLKIAIVFLHEAFRFEVWLAAYNKQVQSQYWKLVGDSDWKKYHLVPSIQGADSILEHVLVDAPDFSDLDAVTQQIERGSLAFIQDVESFLASY